MTLLSGHWPTDWIIYSWFIHRLTDSLVTGSLFDQIIVFTVQELTNWLNNWLIDWISDSTVPGLTKSQNDLYLFIIILDGWLIDWLADSTVEGLTNWLNDLWLVYWLTNWLYCLKTDQHSEWWNLVDWLNKWLHCPRTDHRSKWFMDGWLTIWL